MGPLMRAAAVTQFRASALSFPSLASRTTSVEACRREIVATRPPDRGRQRLSPEESIGNLKI